jgi:hypothetical protein
MRLLASTAPPSPADVDGHDDPSGLGHVFKAEAIEALQPHTVEATRKANWPT